MFSLIYDIQQSNYALRLKKTYKSFALVKYQVEVIKTQWCHTKNDKMHYISSVWSLLIGLVREDTQFINNKKCFAHVKSHGHPRVSQGASYVKFEFTV